MKKQTYFKIFEFKIRSPTAIWFISFQRWTIIWNNKHNHENHHKNHCYSRTQEKTKKERKTHQNHKDLTRVHHKIQEKKTISNKYQLTHTKSIKNLEKLENTCELVLWLFDQGELFDEPFEPGSAKGLEFRNISVVSRRTSYAGSKSWRGWSCAVKIFGFEEQRRRARTEKGGLYHRDRIQTHTDTSISRITHTNTRSRALFMKDTVIYQKISARLAKWIRICGKKKKKKRVDKD